MSDKVGMVIDWKERWDGLTDAHLAWINIYMIYPSKISISLEIFCREMLNLLINNAKESHKMVAGRRHIFGHRLEFQRVHPECQSKVLNIFKRGRIMYRWYRANLHWSFKYMPVASFPSNLVCKIKALWWWLEREFRDFHDVHMTGTRRKNLIFTYTKTWLRSLMVTESTVSYKSNVRFWSKTHQNGVTHRDKKITSEWKRKRASKCLLPKTRMFHKINIPWKTTRES